MAKACLGARDGIAEEVAAAAVILVRLQIHADAVAASVAVRAYIPARSAAASMHTYGQSVLHRTSLRHRIARHAADPCHVTRPP